MARIEITVEEKDRSELVLLLGFRGLPRGPRRVENGLFSIETAIQFAADVEKFERTFAPHLGSLVEIV